MLHGSLHARGGLTLLLSLLQISSDDCGCSEAEDPEHGSSYGWRAALTPSIESAFTSFSGGFTLTSSPARVCKQRTHSRMDTITGSSYPSSPQNDVFPHVTRHPLLSLVPVSFGGSQPPQQQHRVQAFRPSEHPKSRAATFFTTLAITLSVVAVSLSSASVARVNHLEKQYAPLSASTCRPGDPCPDCPAFCRPPSL